MQWNRELLLYISGEGKKCVSSPSLGLLATSEAAHNKKSWEIIFAMFFFSILIQRRCLCFFQMSKLFRRRLLTPKTLCEKEGKNMDTGWKKSSHRQTTIKFPHFLWQVLNKKNWIAYKCFAWKLTAQLFPRSSSWWLILCASGESKAKKKSRERSGEGRKENLHREFLNHCCNYAGKLKVKW